MRLPQIVALISIFACLAFPPLSHLLLPSALPNVQLIIDGHPRDLPGVELSDNFGRPVSSVSFRGRFVLLNIWATWCTPCREEMTSLNRLASLLRTKNIGVVPVSVDSAGLGAVRSFYKRYGLTDLAIYIDPSRNAMRAVGATGIPTTVLIGPDGREIGRMLGAARWDAPASVESILDIAGRYSSAGRTSATLHAERSRAGH